MSGEKKDIDMDELARAFDDKAASSDNKTKKPKKSGKNKKSIAIFAVGLLVLFGGLGFLIFKLVTGPSKADAEFLISAGEWVEEGQPSVIWDFTEIGKGKLTTDKHTTDYDFTWALDGGKLKIETTWLYGVEDEFEYSLDQGSKTLTLKNAEKDLEVKFKVAE